jgi:hypothetical protein
MSNSHVILYNVYGKPVRIATTQDADGVHTLRLGTPVLSAGGNLAVQTLGTDFAPFDDMPCSQLTIVNESGFDVTWRQDGAGAAIPLRDGASFTVFGLTNANQISVRRVDQDPAQVPVMARWER